VDRAFLTSLSANLTPVKKSSRGWGYKERGSNHHISISQATWRGDIHDCRQL
jgi:hypothetical protein